MKTLVAAFTLATLLAGCGVHGQSPMAARAIKSAGASRPAVAVSSASEQERLFKLIDADRDGRVTPRELEGAHFGEPIGGYWPGEKQRAVRRLFAQLDADRDGALSFTEYRRSAQLPKGDGSRVHRMFVFTDLNGDHALSSDEAMEGPFGQPVGGWQPGEKEKQAEAFMRRADADRNGRVSYPEYKAVMAQAGQG